MIENKFKIIVPVYNADKYIARCIHSVKNQSYKKWECCIIDDASTDKTFSLIQQLVTNEPRIKYIHNTENKKAIANVISGIQKIVTDDNEILCFLDGDDFLYDNNVLNYLNTVYQDTNLMLTYGQYVAITDFNKGQIIPGSSEPLKDISEIYKIGRNFSHLKTMKHVVWKRIQDNDLRRWDGKYVQRAWDAPIMIPAMRIAGIDRIRFVDKILYVYNNDNPISEWRIDETEQLKEERYIKEKFKARGKYMEHMIFTEIVNAGKIGRISLESFHKYNNYKVHVYGTAKDFQLLIPNDNNILIDVGDNKEIMEGYKDPSHWGMFLLWAKIITETSAQNLIHFDSDIIFRGDVISDMIQKAEEGFDLIGPRRRYNGYPTVCPTTLIAFNKTKFPNYDSATMARFLCSAHNPDNLYHTDFFDVPMFTIIKNGGKVFHLDFNDVGGVDDTGNRTNACGIINHSLEVGRKMAHFCGACSGQDLYNQLRFKPEQRKDGYAEFSIGSYAVFCKIFYNEIIPDVNITPANQEILKIAKDTWY